MKQRMTREQVCKRAKELNLEAEAQEILVLAEVDLDLQEVTDDKNTKTIPYAFRSGRKTRTIFRFGFDSEEKDERLAGLVVCFPFWARKRNRPWTQDMEALQKALLDTLPEEQRGAQEDIRLALTKNNSDEIMAAIRIMYAEVSENL